MCRIFRNILPAVVGLLLAPQISAKTAVINVRPVDGDATETLQKAVAKAEKLAAKSDVEIRLQPGAVYNISREKATPILYYVSNTTSESENPLPMKHVGIQLKGLRGVTINGQGARIVTHGEMTPWVVDGCQNVVIRDLTIDAADPSVPEMTVEKVDSLSFTARVHGRSDYRLVSGRLYWKGEGWEFTDGIAQIYLPDKLVTKRCPSPVADAIFVEEVEPGLLRFNFASMPDVLPGNVYQMRHSLRTEVAGLITESRNVTLTDLNLNFMGNFGIVAQASENLTYHKLVCAPDSTSGRTNAGFADFLQVSGCRGMVSITDCIFAGSHDDPINVHGTHLRVSNWGDGRKITLEYMHHQTYGFQSFFKGDTIDFVDPVSLQTIWSAQVKVAGINNPRHIDVILDREVLQKVKDYPEVVVENVTWTPSVRITGCKFSLSPTRGILVTTRRPVEIADNEFHRMQMPAIYVSDDASNWYESGPVHNLWIHDNRFVECTTPVISVIPEVKNCSGVVHKNVTITNNEFRFENRPFRPIIRIEATDSIRIDSNTVVSPVYLPLDVVLGGCRNAVLNLCNHADRFN